MLVPNRSPFGVCIFVPCLMALSALPPAVAVDDVEAGQVFEIRLFHLLVATRDEASRIRKDILTAGGKLTDFTAAASKHSKDASTKLMSGCLGWLNADSKTASDIRDAALALDVGKVSDPIKARYGWHLLFVAEKQELKGRGQMHAPSPVLKSTSRTGDESIAIPPAEGIDADAVEIVDRYLAALGGKKTFAAIQDKAERMEQTSYRPPAPATSQFSRYQKRGNLIREKRTIPFPTGKELVLLELFDGIRGWGAAYNTTSLLADNGVYGLVRGEYIDDALLHWRGEGCSLEYAGEGKVEDEPAHTVIITDFFGLNTIRLFFSKDTDLLIKKEWFETNNNRRRQQVGVKREQLFFVYEDIPFSDKSGHKLKVSLVQKFLIDGKLNSQSHHTAIEINKGLDNKLFEKPAGKPFVPPNLRRTKGK